MKVLAIVPARSGSKRLLQKNKRILEGKPLIQWTLDFTTHLPDFCHVLLTSDDPEIIEFSKNRNISAPWVRPAELALDSSSSTISVRPFLQATCKGVVPLLSVILVSIPLPLDSNSLTISV